MASVSDLWNLTNCPRCAALLEQHHYLGSLKPVGERLHYHVTDAHGDCLGVPVFCVAIPTSTPVHEYVLRAAGNVKKLL